MELLDFRKKNPVTWTYPLTIARSLHEEGSTGSTRTTNDIRDKQFQLHNSLAASNLAEIHKQHKRVSKCGDRKTLRLKKSLSR